MRISFALLCHNEDESLQTLMGQLLVPRQYEYEIIIVHDVDKPRTSEVIEYYRKNRPDIKLYERPLNNDYAAQKNFMTEKCSGDYIINPDADELFPEYLLENIHLIIEQNDTECIWLPRTNIVNGMTPELAPRFGFRLNEKGWINWPDFQSRVYKNDYPRIHWKKPVHERITGYKTHSLLPFDVEMAEHLAIVHKKDMDTQIRQNQKYAQIMGQR